MYNLGTCHVKPCCSRRSWYDIVKPVCVVRLTSVSETRHQRQAKLGFRVSRFIRLLLEYKFRPLLVSNKMEEIQATDMSFPVLQGQDLSRVAQVSDGPILSTNVVKQT